MSAPRELQVYFEDMLGSIEKIELYTADCTLDKFRGDTQKQDAVVRNLEIIGEAAKKIPEEVRAAHPGIQWQPAAAMRDYLIHDYPDVDPEVVWDTITKDLPELKKQLLAMPMNR